MAETLRNGQTCMGIYCEMCSGSTAGYGYSKPMKYIDGKRVCMVCYPIAVDAYLADLRLRETKGEQ